MCHLKLAFSTAVRFILCSFSHYYCHFISCCTLQYIFSIRNWLGKTIASLHLPPHLTDSHFHTCTFDRHVWIVGKKVSVVLLLFVVFVVNVFVTSQHFRVTFLDILQVKTRTFFSLGQYCLSPFNKQPVYIRCILVPYMNITQFYIIQIIL